MTGCGTVVSSAWHDDAHFRFEAALSAGAAGSAPEEAENILSTLTLADRFYRQELFEEADSLYQLSSQKTQLLLRTLLPVSDSQADEIMHHDDEILSASRGIPAKESARIDADRQTESLTPALEDGSTSDSRNGSNTFKPGNSGLRSKPRSTGRTSLSALNMSGERSRSANPAKKTIYLTFDDGPSKLTLPIASFLSSQGIPATFFVLGNNVKGQEKIIRSTIAMGHRVASHTMSHDLKKLRASFDTDANEVERTRELIEPLGGDGRMVRIPYGAVTKRMSSEVAAEGGQIFDWDINSHDSTGRGAKDPKFIEKNVVRLLNQADKKRVVILFHDGSGHEATLAALHELIPRLKQQGYSFDTLERNEKIAKSREAVLKSQ
jgi:peptidoglycan/xylan/chitin deacetylase (PgdA/CDA1 family)